MFARQNRVYDATGNNGKSRLVEHLVCEYGAVQLSGEKKDMAYVYNTQPVAVFDVPRGMKLASCTDMFYFAEELKNGNFMSSKYVAKHKRFAPPHVIFLSNEDAPKGVWSEDRLQVVKLGARPAFKPFTEPILTPADHDKRGAGVDVQGVGIDSEIAPTGIQLFMRSYKERADALQKRLAEEEAAAKAAKAQATVTAMQGAMETFNNEPGDVFDGFPGEEDAYDEWRRARDEGAVTETDLDM